MSTRVDLILFALLAISGTWSSYDWFVNIAHGLSLSPGIHSIWCTCSYSPCSLRSWPLHSTGRSEVRGEMRRDSLDENERFITF
jgi:hypothetical protein